MIKTGYLEAPTQNYTRGAWEGVNCSLHLGTKEIAKLLRKELKELYPSCKYSITTEYNQISVSLMVANKTPFENLDNINFNHLATQYNYGHNTAEEVREIFESEIEDGYYQVNHFHIDSRTLLSKHSKDMFTKIKEILNSFNYDDSDGQIDYFSTGFYIDLAIGRWDKPLKIIKV